MSFRLDSRLVLLRFRSYFSFLFFAFSSVGLVFVSCFVPCRFRSFAKYIDGTFFLSWVHEYNLTHTQHKMFPLNYQLLLLVLTTISCVYRQKREPKWRHKMFLHCKIFALVVGKTSDIDCDQNDWNTFQTNIYKTLCITITSFVLHPSSCWQHDIV